VYFLSKARINIAKKQFNNVNNEYEISLGNESEVEPVRWASLRGGRCS
jgi:replication factor A1